MPRSARKSVNKASGRQKQQQEQTPATNGQQHGSQTADNKQAKDNSGSKVLKYLDDYRSSNDIKSLREEGYEVDYDRLVGVGAQSAVFLAHSIQATPPPLDKNGQKPLYTPGYDIAVKIIAKKWINTKKPTKTRTGNLKLALALGQTKPENNILKVIDIFKTPERIFIFMQYCAYGNVISFIRRNGSIPSRLAQRWSSQMAVALTFLHKFHVAHRNYKLENVLIDDNLNAKLTGFGLSKFCIDLQTKQPLFSKTICGSEPYLAPEMLKESSERNYDPKQADVWAFGVGMYLCITRRYPFEAENLRALKLEQLARKFLERDTSKRLRTALRELLSAVFSIDPNQRPTMQEVWDRSTWLREGVAASQRAVAAATSMTPPQKGARSPPMDAAGPSSSSKPARSPGAASGASTAPTGPAQRPQQQQRQGRRGSTCNITSQQQQTAAKAQDISVKSRLSPVTPVSYQPTDALPVVQSEMPKD